MRPFPRLLLVAGLIAFLVGLVWVGEGTGYFSSLPDQPLPGEGDRLEHGLFLAGAGIVLMAISIMF